MALAIRRGAVRLCALRAAGGTVFRYTPVDGHANTLALDPFGNLWIGDDPSGGAVNFSGRLWRIPSARLTSIP